MATAAQSQPLVSIILPATGAGDSLAASLRSLLDQDADPATYEVLVALDEADHAVRQSIEPLLAERGVARPVDVSAAGGASPRARALNTGLDEVRGSHVLFFDPDQQASPSLVRLLAQSADGVHVPLAEVVDTDSSGQAHQSRERVSLAHSPDRFPAIEEVPEVAADPAGTLYPAEWLAGVRFPEDLVVGAEDVFLHTLLGPYPRRFSQFDLNPGHQGARIHRSGPSDLPESPADAGTALAPSHREVIARLTGGQDAITPEQSSLTRLLVREHAAQLRAHAQASADRTKAAESVDLSGDPILVDTERWPTPATLEGDTSWTRWPEVVVLAATGRHLERAFRQIAFLRAKGTKVALAYHSGSLDKLKKVPHTRLRGSADSPAAVINTAATRVAGNSRSLWQRASAKGRRVGRRAARRVLSEQLVDRVLPAPSTDEDASTANEGFPSTLHEEDLASLRQARLVVAMDDASADLATQQGLRWVGAAELHGQVLAISAVRRNLTTTNAKAVTKAADKLAEGGTAPQDMPPVHVWGLSARNLMMAGHLEQARRVLDQARKIFPGAETDGGLDVLAATADVLEHGVLPPEAIPAATACTSRADAAWEIGDEDTVVYLMELVCELLFHPEVHSNVAEPPLVYHPDELLGPLRDSRVWGLLTAHRPESAPSGRAPGGKESPRGDAQRLLLLPGAYPKFWQVVTADLPEETDVEMLRLVDTERAFGAMVPWAGMLRMRLRFARGESPSLSPEVDGAFAGRDVVFADWCDKGAVLASMMTPPGTRLVIRFHGVDSLGLWQFLVDWSRVTDVVFVSDHLRATVTANLGERLAGTRLHTVNNGVDLERFDVESTADAHRTLGMVGWAQKVKDPEWALEVLGQLRAQDPSWRIRLIGADLPLSHGRRSEQQVADSFRERALRPDVAAGIEYVGFTTDLPRHLAGVGFALSSSLREGSPVGAAEMVAAHAVPVFRNWPAFRRHGGASYLFGPSWVVDTPQEAVQRILAVSDRDEWEKAATEARAVVAERFNAEGTSRTYREIVLDQHA